jgi:hypothetical protein
MSQTFLKSYQPVINFFLGGRSFQKAEMILAEVVSDAKDPRRDFFRITRGVQILLDFNEGFLDEVIGDRLILYRGQDEFPDSVVVLIVNSQ